MKMSTNKWVNLISLAAIVLMISSGTSLSKEVSINMMIDFESPGSPTPDQVIQAFQMA